MDRSIQELSRITLWRGRTGEAKAIPVKKMAAKVIVFSTPSCIWCKKVKEYLKSINQNFTDIDVSKDIAARKDMIRKSGQEAVPQLWINNIPVVGFEREKIKRLLNLNNTKKGESDG